MHILILGQSTYCDFDYTMHILVEVCWLSSIVSVIHSFDFLILSAFDDSTSLLSYSPNETELQGIHYNTVDTHSKSKW